MKAVYSREGDFLVQGVWQGCILLHFPLHFNYQLPITAVPKIGSISLVNIFCELSFSFGQQVFESILFWLVKAFDYLAFW
jgi:hypothetical protein